MTTDTEEDKDMIPNGEMLLAKGAVLYNSNQSDELLEEPTFYTMHQDIKEKLVNSKNPDKKARIERVIDSLMEKYEDEEKISSLNLIIDNYITAQRSIANIEKKNNGAKKELTEIEALIRSEKNKIDQILIEIKQIRDNHYQKMLDFDEIEYQRYCRLKDQSQ